jgi:hypothetical protein
VTLNLADFETRSLDQIAAQTRRPVQVAAVALANNIARMAWAAVEFP